MTTSPASVFGGPVVVVGAGVAGLVTAHLLAEAGAEVVVIEKLEQIGGLARSFVYDDKFVFDCGPHRFDTTNPNIDAYLKRLFKPKKARLNGPKRDGGKSMSPRHVSTIPSFVNLLLGHYDLRRLRHLMSRSTRWSRRTRCP